MMESRSLQMLYAMSVYRIIKEYRHE